MRSGGDWERPTPYKMWLDETQDIDIPEPMTSKASYSATLGHKVYIFLKTSGWFSGIFSGVSQLLSEQRDGSVLSSEVWNDPLYRHH